MVGADNSVNINPNGEVYLQLYAGLNIFMKRKLGITPQESVLTPLSNVDIYIQD